MVGKRQNEAKKVVNPSPNFKKISRIVQQIKYALQAKILSVKETGLNDFLRVFY